MIGTLIANLLMSLRMLSPVEILAAVAAVTYAVGGLAALWISESRSHPTARPAHKTHRSAPPFKAAA
jgi:hypothetical protein